jgi:hypothetical protein
VAHGYDIGMGQRQDDREQHDWSQTIRRAASEVTNAVGESSRQLGAAAERFAGQSLAWLEHLAGKADQSASFSERMAESAARAADEARRVQEEVAETARDATERIERESGEAVAASARLSQKQSHLLEDFTSRLQASIAACQEAAAQALRAVDEARRLTAVGTYETTSRELSRGAEGHREPESIEREEPAAAFGGKLEGRVILSVAPVPDFERLLTIDGALGRMASVRVVTLDDYADDEVTFRVDMERPVGLDDFVEELASRTSHALEVTAALGGNFRLQVRDGE